MVELTKEMFKGLLNDGKFTELEKVVAESEGPGGISVEGYDILMYEGELFEINKDGIDDRRFSMEDFDDEEKRRIFNLLYNEIFK